MAPPIIFNSLMLFCPAGREALPILDKVEQAADVVWTLRQNADRWPAEEGQQVRLGGMLCPLCRQAR